MFFSNLYHAMKDEYRRWRDGPPLPPAPRPGAAPPASPPSPLLSTPAPAPASPVSASDLPAVKNWSHPFGDTSHPLQQLTNLAKAQAGYFPLGRNGLWHGGVHFDSGTAGTVGPEGQSHVRCLADGEVIAYRIPEHTPKTKFFPGPGVTIEAPFASGFVLVRHRLEAPRIEGSPDTPPSLIVYSLYMHLADWASYQADTGKARPAFWPESSQRRVKTATDVSPVNTAERGLSLRHAPTRGKTIGFLRQGATVTVSGEGGYRKVEGIQGPVELQNPDGTLRGYVGFDYLKDLGGGIYRVNTNNDDLYVRPAPNRSQEHIFKLPKGTDIAISGEGEFRKLESVVQYVHAASLESERVPERGKVVVLDRPVPIKAGSLIGHLGPYQDSKETSPQEKLHLEVFACDNVETFFTKSRAWANRLPEKDKTWLKLEKGTKVVTHQASFSTTRPPHLAHPHALTGAPLLLPRAMLDGLAADRKIAVPAGETTKARNWYRLENLLIGADGTTLPDVWVCDEVGVTPWVNPWSWDGYAVIYNDDSPRSALAHFLLNLGDYFDEQELEQWKPLAEASDRGPVRRRLFDLIDADRNGVITAKEIQQALEIPAYAQSISQLVIHYESEWYYQQRKWDALDEVLGHTNSTPILNWVAEKERIKELSWWGDVAAKGALPASGSVYHLQPVALSCALKDKVIWFDIDRFVAEYKKQHASTFGFYSGSRKINIPELTSESEVALTELLREMKDQYYSYFEEYNEKYIAYMLSTIRIESYQYRDKLFFKPVSEYISYAQAEVDYGSGPTASDKDRAIKNHNSSTGDGYKYRGRGLVQLTWKINYMKFSRIIGVDMSENPDMACDMPISVKIMMLGMRDGGFRSGHTLERYLGSGKSDYYNARLIINGYRNGVPDKAYEFEGYANLFEKSLNEAK